jgi:hypothetical protein
VSPYAGYDKQLHIAHLHNLGFKLMVEPQAFIIHRAHEYSPIR